MRWPGYDDSIDIHLDCAHASSSSLSAPLSTRHLNDKLPIVLATNDEEIVLKLSAIRLRRMP